MPLMLEVRNLVVERDSRIVLQNLNLSVANSELMNLTGANGVGKTTLLRALCGLVQLEEGEVLWNGVPVQNNSPEFYSNLIFIGHENGIKGELTPLENLRVDRLIQSNSSKIEIREILESLGIGKVADKPCHFLSAGQKRLVALGRLVVSSAKLWLLDEPMAALDVRAQRCFLEILNRHLNSGGLGIATSHQPFAWKQTGIVEKHLEPGGVLK